MSIEPNVDMAAVVAAVRAKELDKEAPLVEDKDASKFVDQKTRAFLKDHIKDVPYFENLMIVRHRLFDDIANRLIEENNISQIVSLGAGYSTSLERLCSRFDSVEVGIECDLPYVIEKKAKLIGRPYKPIQIPIDLTTESSVLLDRLEANGFDQNRQSLFLLEGLLYYFDNDALQDQLLYSISKAMQAQPCGMIVDVHTKQVGTLPQSILSGMKKAGVERHINDVSSWCKRFESAGFFVRQSGAISALDEWKRFETQGQCVSSTIFVLSGANDFG